MRRRRILRLTIAGVAVLACCAPPAGALTFSNGSNYPLPDPSAPFNSPSYGGVAIGDFNRDGRPEIVVPRENDSKLWLFPNKGNGTFGAAKSSPACDTFKLTLGRLTPTSNPYLALLCTGGQFQLLPGDGHDGFGSAINSQFAASRGGMAIGNLDGHQDLVFDIGNDVSQNVCYLDILAFTGQPQCDPNSDFREVTNQLTLANIFRPSAHTTQRVINMADATHVGVVGYTPAVGWSNYASLPTGATGGGTLVAAGDLNRDGVDDLVEANFAQGGSAGSLYSFTSGAGGTISHQGHLAAASIPNAYYLQLADFNRDGKLDAIVGGDDGHQPQANPEFAIMLGHGDGTFSAPQIFSTKFSPDSTAWWLGVSDLNGDGKADVVIVNGDEQTVRVFLNTTPTGVLLAHLRATARIFHIGTRLPHFTRTVPTGTTFSFTVSPAARVTFAFTALLAGKKSGGHCVAPRPSLRHAPSCTRRRPAGSLSVSATAGTHRLFFDGRLSSHKTLAPGKYELAVTARAGGIKSPVRKLVLTLLPPH